MTSSTRFSFKNVAICAISLSAPAYSLAAANPGLFNGYYGGVAGGVMRTESKISASATSTYANRYDEASVLAYSQDDVRVHKYTGVGDIYLGFGHFVNDSYFYLAGEIFANFAHRNNSLNNWVFHSSPNDDRDFESISANTTMKLRNTEYGVDIRPGYLMDTNTLVYGRIGVAFNKVKNDTTNTFSFTSTRAVITPGNKNFVTTLNQSKNKNVTGLRLGIGLEHKITDTLAITADYIYTYYGKASTSGVATTTTYGEDGAGPLTNVDGLQASSSGRMSTSTGMLGIKYYFLPVC